MEVYTPPIAAVTGGIVVVILCFMLRIPIFLIGLLSAVVLVYTIFVHRSIFNNEYKTMSLPEFFKANAPIFIILAVIVIALGYILYLFGPKGAIHNAPMLSSNSTHTAHSSWFGSNSSESKFNPSSWFGSNPSAQQRNSNRMRSNSYPSQNSLRRRDLEDEISRRV